MSCPVGPHTSFLPCCQELTLPPLSVTIAASNDEQSNELRLTLAEAQHE
jgi:hypothetical protein